MAHGIELLQTGEYRAKLDQCLHCGLCLEACPTYALSGREIAAPRGRIALMRAVADGRAAIDDPALTTSLDGCLACRACETACPSGVQYGALIEGMRVAMAPSRRPGPAARAISWLGLRQLMPHLGRLRWLARATWLYQRSGLQRLVRTSGLLPKHLRAIEAIAPPITLRRRDYRQIAPAIGPRRGRVAFVYGCIQEAFLGQVNDATVRVLQRNGFEVLAPLGQTCCGAAQLHVGDEQLARQLARQNVDALLGAQVDAIIVNAGGCGLAMKEYGQLLRDEPGYQARVREFVAKVRDISEFLAEQRLDPPRGAVPVVATYADSCHLRHGQKVVQPPREILRAIPGLRLVELAAPDRCCGSAGVYNITHPDAAGQVLDAKLADIAATGADVVVVSNTGCHMQLVAGVRQAGLKAQVRHVVELLDMAYAAER